MSRPLRIATRQSPLALWQAEYVKRRLQKAHPALDVELVAMTSRGDQILDSPLSKVGGKGLFVKELQLAMLEDRADIAVHSMKDVPMELPPELEIAAICEREDPRDALVSERFASLDELPRGAVLGTSSLRRQCQILRLRPDLDVQFLRGNVNTRLRRLDEGDFDAILLASAGLIRLGLQERIRESLAAEVLLPAGGQGAVGIELRCDDRDTKALLAELHHSPTAHCVLAERALCRHLQGGCQVPIAAYALYDEDADLLWLRALVGTPDGSEFIYVEDHAPSASAEELGRELGRQLLDRGADKILASIYE